MKRMHAPLISFLLAFAACTDAPSGDEDGVPTCFDGLPDLDGSGAADEGDCALASVGVTVRMICAGLEDWSALELCHGVSRVDTTTLDRPVASILAGPDRARFTVLLWRQSDGAPRVWSDTNENGVVDQGELHYTGLQELRSRTDLVADASGCVGIAAEDTPGTVVALWHDANCDLLADPSEKGLVSLNTSGFRIFEKPFMGFVSGHPVIVFSEYGPSSNSNIIAWADLNENRQVDIGERVVIASSSTLNGVDTTSSVAVVYSNSSGSYRWTTQDGWAIASSSPLTPARGFETRWFERDRSGSGVARLVAAKTSSSDGGLIINNRTVPYQPAYDSPIGLGADSSDLMYLSFTTINERGLWVDWNRDWSVNPTEFVMRGRDGASGNAFPAVGTLIDGSPLFVDFNIKGHQAVESERWWPRSSTKYLGETCDSTVDHCVDGLECRVSGDAADPHCVPSIE